MLDRLIEEMMREIDRITTALQNDQMDALQWEIEFGRIIARFEAAAWLAGGEDVRANIERIETLVTEQYTYLADFANEIRQSAVGEWRASWNARARMYAGAIKQAYWESRTYGVPLPAQPAQGTQCLTNCLCSWRIVQLDGDENWDCTWVRNAADSCQTCIQRGADWAPLRIRGGRIL